MSERDGWTYGPRASWERCAGEACRRPQPLCGLRSPDGKRFVCAWCADGRVMPENVAGYRPRHWAG